MLLLLFALILFVISVLIHMVGRYIGLTIALSIGAAVTSAIMAPVMAMNKFLADKAARRTGMRSTPKSPYIILALEVALVIFLIVKPSANVLDFAEKTAKIDITQRYFNEDGTVSDPETEPVTDPETVEKLVEVLDRLTYKRTFQKYVNIDMPGPQYVMVMKDKNGDVLGTVSINSSQSITVISPDGNSKNYNVYFGSPESDRRIIISSIDTRFVSPRYEREIALWDDFIAGVKSGFKFDDNGNMTFTMPQAPDVEYTEFNMEIEKVMQDGNKRKFVEIYDSGSTDLKIPSSETFTWQIKDHELLYLKVDLNLDNMNKPLEIRNIPARYKYDNQKN